MTASAKRAEAARRLTPLQVVTLILSIYVLLALLAQSLFTLPPDTNALLDRIDFFVCLVFLADFFTRLIQAPSKLDFLKWGWIDFVSSIPMLDIFRVGRVVRIIRVPNPARVSLEPGTSPSGSDPILLKPDSSGVPFRPKTAVSEGQPTCFAHLRLRSGPWSACRGRAFPSAMRLAVQRCP